MKTSFLLAFLFTLLASRVSAQTPAAPPLPSDAEIRGILAARIDQQKQGVGIVVGVISPEGRRVISHGRLNQGDPRRLGGDTEFEIGSMTKVFTSLVLMDMVQHHEVAVDDPVAKYLPPSVQVPERNGRKITLGDLSTQSSGLPPMPDNFHPKNPANPYADYGPEQLYQFLSGYALTRDIGSQYEYSNLGVGLLGLALSRHAGTDFETMVRSRILQPLGMKDTAVALSPDQTARLAPGHTSSLKVTANWDFAALAGAGALRSTANDLLTFLAANLGLTNTPLASAMAAEAAPRRPTGTPHLQIAYAWHVWTRHGKTILWHNGGTGGYRSFMGYNPAARLGIVVLSNTFTGNGVDDIGNHLLDPASPLAKLAPPKEHKAIMLDSKALDAFAGRYQLAPNFVLTVTANDGHLYAQATGQGRFELFPETPRSFFAKVTELTVDFAEGPQGPAPALVLHQGGQSTKADRIE